MLLCLTGKKINFIIVYNVRWLQNTAEWLTLCQNGRTQRIHVGSAVTVCKVGGTWHLISAQLAARAVIHYISAPQFRLNIVQA